MKNIFLIIMITISGLALSLEYISEVHENGMPKVVKVYSSNYGKLNLSKETGYYFNGSQKYQKTYYKGEIKSFYQWDQNGNKVKTVAGWTPEREQEFIEDFCRAGKYECVCILEIVKKSFTYEEVLDIDGGNFMAYEERVEDIRVDLEKCIDSAAPGGDLEPDSGKEEATE